MRKAHNNGKNHIANVRNYYAGSLLSLELLAFILYSLNVPEISQDKAQAIIDEITKAYENSTAGIFADHYDYVYTTQL